MSKEKKVQQILESWQGSGRLNVDSWENVKRVLDFYGFQYRQRKHWICQHPDFIRLVKCRDSTAIILFETKMQEKRLELTSNMEFSIAVRHEKDAKSEVKRPYLDILLSAVSLLEDARFMLGKQQQKEVDNP